MKKQRQLMPFGMTWQEHVNACAKTRIHDIAVVTAERVATRREELPSREETARVAAEIERELFATFLRCTGQDEEKRP